jgi:uncharacterized membrane protein YfcA
MMPFMEWITYLSLGAFAGTLAGLLGVGGGLVIVPVLILLFKEQGFSHQVLVHLAIGTSLATIVFTSLSSVWAHHHRRAVLWPEFWQLTPGIVIGALTGAIIAKLIPGADLRTIFGIFELIVAVQMGLNLKPDARRQLPSAMGMGLAGGVIGTVSAIVGIGGGTMSVPFLTWCNVAMQKAVATSAACGLPIAIAGAIGFVVAGWGEAGLPSLSSGYLYWPAFAGIVAASVLFAPLGARLAHALPGAMLKKVFALFIGMLGIRMLWG